MKDIRRIDIHLHEAYGLIWNDRPAMARMALTKVICLMRPIKDDYSDVKDMYIKAAITLSSIKREWWKRNTKEWALMQVSNMINETQEWLRYRDVA